MTATYVINERPLSDDTLTVASAGHVFKGGYAAIVSFHTFRNAWEDTEHVRRFRTVKAAERFIESRYGRPLDDLLYGTEEGD